MHHASRRRLSSSAVAAAAAERRVTNISDGGAKNILAARLAQTCMPALL